MSRCFWVAAILLALFVGSFVWVWIGRRLLESDADRRSRRLGLSAQAVARKDRAQRAFAGLPTGTTVRSRWTFQRERTAPCKIRGAERSRARADRTLAPSMEGR